MAVTYEVVTQLVEVEEVPEKLPESPWHNKNVEAVKELLDEIASRIQGAAVFRDLYFRFQGKKYAPDLAVVLEGAPPIESIGSIYDVPQTGPAPAAVIEIAVSPKSLGEALSEKAAFYAAMGVRDYLVVEAIPSYPVRLWFGRLDRNETPTHVKEARLETLGVTVKVEGQDLKMFDEQGNQVLPPKSLAALLRKELEQVKAALEEERRKREELEQKLAELEKRLGAGN